MAATVVDATDNRREQAPFLHVGLTPVFKTVEVQTTSVDEVNDAVLLYEFPAVAFVRNVAGAVTYDIGTLDSNGTPTWAASLGIGDSDGVLDTTLKTGIDEDDLGESDAVSGGNAWLDVGGKFLILRTTTAAATAAAADVSVGFEFAAGLREINHDGS
jgi:hypothetical protein